MLAKWPIRNKLLLGVALLTVLVVTLSTSGIIGVYAYRSLVRSLHNRAAELPLAGELAQRISDLRVSATSTPSASEPASSENPETEPLTPHDRFTASLKAVQTAFDNYSSQLDQNDRDDFPINDRSQERTVVGQMRDTIADLAEFADKSAWPLPHAVSVQLNRNSVRPRTLAGQLPSFLSSAGSTICPVKCSGRYRTLIILDLVDDDPCAGDIRTAGALCSTAGCFGRCRCLLTGSRVVAGGNFSYRIRLDSNDEMAELAESLNDMTVALPGHPRRSRSPGATAHQAGGAQRAIGQRRLSGGRRGPRDQQSAGVDRDVRRIAGKPAGRDRSRRRASNRSSCAAICEMIQTEAFRCKEITEKLLDFSRLGDVQHQTDRPERVGPGRDRHGPPPGQVPEKADSLFAAAGPSSPRSTARRSSKSC